MFDRILNTLLIASDKFQKICQLLGSMREKCPYSEFFWSVFSGIWTEYGESTVIRENVDQKTSKYGPFSRSDSQKIQSTMV